MEVSINVEDYLSKDEIKCICEDEISNIVRRAYGDDKDGIETLISNMAYRFVWKMIDEYVDGELEKLIRDNVIRVINELSGFSVFRPQEAWRNVPESIGYKILCEEVASVRPLIRERVEKVVEEYPFDEIKYDEIGYVVSNCIMEKLFGERTSVS